MTGGRPTAVPQRAREVLAYFLRNPKAADSLEGIARWRVPLDAVHVTVDQVGHALGWLVDQGFLIEESGAGVVPVYRLNQNRARDAEHFITQTLSAPRPDAGTEPPRDLIGHGLVWVDATLRRFLREHPSPLIDTPGLTRSFASIDAMLSTDVAANSADLDAAWLAVDRASGTVAELCAIENSDEPLARLYQRLGLTWLELQVVMLCLAPEIDAKYQTVYGVLNDDMSRRSPALGLVCRILGDPLAVRTELAASGGLLWWRLLDNMPVMPHADELLRLDGAVVSWLLGLGTAVASDPRVAPVLRGDPWPGGAWLRRSIDVIEIERLAKTLAASESGRRWLVLSGDDSDGWKALVEMAALDARVPLLRIELASLAIPDSNDMDDLAARLARATLLAGAVAVIDETMPREESIASRSRLSSTVISRLAATGCPMWIVASDLEQALVTLPCTGCAAYRRSAPETLDISHVYSAAAADAGLYLSGLDAERLAMSFPLPLSGIDAAVRLATLQGAAGLPLAEHASALSTACRRVASPDLPRFARRVEPAFSLDDVVLPADRRAQLDEIVAHVHHASQVLNTWGFGAQLPYGRGIAALFSGPSGVGKSMAAQAIAHALHTETFVVDLSRIQSKYIGDSEKHIDAAFRDAQRAGAVLQIDEAEALFGKRSEVKDSHDRYANIEVAYLLQRMEAFDGVAILTTNFRQNLDQAFLRRLRFVVEFPKPDADAREAIWRRCLPESAPCRRDLNLRFLARRLDLTGGNIRQITVRAAFAAAHEGAMTIEMRHIVGATRAELIKLGMPSAERDLAEFEAAQRDLAARVA